jgi:spore germination protein YaaH/flagellar hook assembly protein FlgD
MIVRRPHARRHAPTGPSLVAVAAAMLVLSGLAPVLPPAPVAASDATAGDANTAGGPPATLQPTVQYEEAVAHAGDKTAFAPGDRVSVPFTPRAADRWAVGGVRPSELPAGRVSGKALRSAKLPGPPARNDPPAAAATGFGGGPALASIDRPHVDPASASMADLAAAVDPGGLKREVFGFLPYWELTDSSTRLDWEKLSTVAYFGVGVAANGDLQKQNGDGSTTVGWSGWTSAAMTKVMNNAHASGARVVLTVQSFAWTSAGVARQRSLLGSSANRANLARQIAAAVRDRGADGVNLDFEPIISTYSDEFTALVRTIRTELNKVHRGYQVTFDTSGWIGNYPIGDATASGGADAVVVMGYDYRTGSSSVAGSVAPIAGPTYDIGDTIRAYLARIPASKVILGVPYYGRAWSTSSSALNAKNVSGAKNGASTTVVYGTAVTFAADHGRKWDSTEGVAWTVYRRKNCTAKYGCVNPWRELYYDDAKALGLKYDLINHYNLRGAGIWALGYDGTRTELYAMLKAKFITDTVPPVISASFLSGPLVSPNGDGRLETVTVRVTATGLIRYGWTVQPIVNGVAGSAVRTGGAPGRGAGFTWDGRDDKGRIVPDGSYRITVWTADASNNRAAVAKDVTVDRRPATVTARSSSSFISPNGDGHSDRTTLAMTADEAITGSARVFDSHGTTVRRWAFSKVTGGSWAWNGRNTAGTTVADGRYTFRVAGLDRAGNRTIRDLAVTVDRTIRSVTWSRGSFVPKAGQHARMTFSLKRSARVTVSILQGDTPVRSIWTAKPFGAGSHGWTWNGRATSGALVKPGAYRVVITTSSWVGTSSFSRNIVVR